MVRDFLAAEIVIFATAALMHAGLFGAALAHAAARNAETIIGVVLIAGLMAIGTRPDRTRQFGLLSQGLALAGTCVGLVTIAIGIGPRSLVDLMLHVTMIILLVGGLCVAAHAGTARHA
jgi:hypothetical protein